MYGDQRQRDTGKKLTIAAGTDLAFAAGAGAARLTRAAIVQPFTALVAGALRLGEHALPDASGHRVVASLATRGELIRAGLERAAAEAARAALRWAVEGAVSALDLTELIRAHVDLDALAAAIDVDAVVARADVDAVVARTDLDAALGKLDLDAVLFRIDLDAILQRIDLDAVITRVDLDAVLARIGLDAVLSRVDLDAVLRRIDVEAIVATVDLDQVASRVDLDAILQRIDPDAVIARVDLDAVLARLDLPAITREVIDAIDLPEIMRQSTGAVSSQAARSVRAEGMSADESVARFVDRVLRRPHPRGAVT